MRIRPCIDLHEGKVKQVVGGTITDDRSSLIENFVSEKSPEYYATKYKNDNLAGGHIIKLGPGNDSAAIEALKAFPGGMQIGGGLNPKNCKLFLDAGASHIIVTSYIFSNGKFSDENLKKMVDTIGKDKLVIDLSCRKRDNDYFVVTDRWQKFTSMKIEESNISYLAKYCDEFLIHAADVEGLRKGYDKNLVNLLSDISPITTTYAGGIRSLVDVEEFKKDSFDKLDATVGSALDLFGGNLSYEKLVEWQNN